MADPDIRVQHLDFADFMRMVGGSLGGGSGCDDDGSCDCGKCKSRKEEETSALCQACEDNSSLMVVKALLDADPSALNTPGSFGHTPLWIAVNNNSDALVKYLLQQGADPFVPCSTQTVWDLAFNSDRPVLLRLLEAHCVVNHPVQLQGALISACSNGLLPIHRAAKAESINTMEFLLRMGVSLEALDSRGCTPLITAAQNEKDTSIIFLVEVSFPPHPPPHQKLTFVKRGAKVTAVSGPTCQSPGSSALHYVVANKNAELVDYLLEVSA